MAKAKGLIGIVLFSLIGCGQSQTPVAKQPPTPPANEAARPVEVQTPKPAETPKPPPAKDDFAVGSRFKGQRKMTKGADQQISLVVTKRDGADFEGEFSIKGERLKEPFVVKVTGKAGLSGGTVAFSTDKAGQFQQSFTGEYKDGKLAFECRGKTRNGQDGSGKGVLEREK